MYDFRVVSVTRNGTEISTLAAPADLIKDLDANVRSYVCCLFGGVVDDKDRLRPCKEGEEPTHYVGTANYDKMDVFHTPNYISIAVGKNDFTDKFQKVTGDTVFFNRDEDGAIYAMLANGSKYYLTKKKILAKNGDGNITKLSPSQAPGIFEMDMVSMVHTDPEQVAYNIVRAYMDRSGSTILFDKCRHKLMGLYHGMDVLVHYNVVTGRVCLSLDYTENSLNEAACTDHDDAKPFGFKMIYNEPGGNVLLTVGYQLSIRQYLKSKRKRKATAIRDVDILLDYISELSNDKYNQSR